MYRSEIFTEFMSVKTGKSTIEQKKLIIATGKTTWKKNRLRKNTY